MGSLMAGWDSPVSDPKSVKFKRNQSLTKEEIDAYWNLKKKIQDEHLEALSPSTISLLEVGASSSSSSTSPSGDQLVMGHLPVRSRSVPSTVVGDREEESLEKVMMKRKVEGWWTRSNSAFLNEPPVIERASNTYPAQFHIATNPTTTTSSSSNQSAEIITN